MSRAGLAGLASPAGWAWFGWLWCQCLSSVVLVVLAAVLGLVLVVQGKCSVDCAQHWRGLQNKATQIHSPMDRGSAPLGTVCMHADQLAARVSFVARIFRHA